MRILSAIFVSLLFILTHFKAPYKHFHGQTEEEVRLVILLVEIQTSQFPVTN